MVSFFCIYISDSYHFIIKNNLIVFAILTDIDKSVKLKSNNNREKPLK